ncbi:MAG TPA: DUF4249 family protein, partial [Chitinophagales bacterium]|nr:DUF4249 family protein [Chitinophagales bacterium]
MPLPRFVWLALSLFGFASCEKEITVKVPDHVSQLVLHSVSATGDSIVMRASRSVGILEYTPGLNLTVADATVVLYDNGLAVDTLGYDAMMEQYVSEHTAEPGHIYTLHAQTPTLGPVFASAGIPASVALNSIQRFQNAKVNSNGGSMDELVLTFNDDGMSTDYYRVSLFTGGFFFYGCAQSNDPGIESPSDDF